MTTRAEPLRIVTHKCATCAKKFKSHRVDGRYCSGACRQRAHRSRSAGGTLENLDQEIDRARNRYWALIAIKAHMLKLSRSEVLTCESQFVDETGNVFMRGVLVGHVKPDKPGWSTWGAEVAGPPYAPPGQGRDGQAGYYESAILGRVGKKKEKGGKRGVTTADRLPPPQKKGTSEPTPRPFPTGAARTPHTLPPSGAD